MQVLACTCLVQPIPERSLPCDVACGARRMETLSNGLGRAQVLAMFGLAVRGIARLVIDLCIEIHPDGLRRTAVRDGCVLRRHRRAGLSRPGGIRGVGARFSAPACAQDECNGSDERYRDDGLLSHIRRFAMAWVASRARRASADGSPT